MQVCKPGSSYNPEKSVHQEVLAEAVAMEVTKELKRELEPVPPPLTILGLNQPTDPEGNSSRLNSFSSLRRILS